MGTSLSGVPQRLWVNAAFSRDANLLQSELRLPRCWIAYSGRTLQMRFFTGISDIPREDVRSLRNSASVLRNSEQ